LVIVLSSFPSNFFPPSSLWRRLHAALLLRFAWEAARFTALRKNRWLQAKIAGCVHVRWRIVLLRLRNTPATANVRADFFQRKKNFIKKRNSGFRLASQGAFYDELCLKK